MNVKDTAQTAALAAACAILWAAAAIIETPDNAAATALWGAGLFLQQHLFTALLPAFILAGATAVFLDRRTVATYLGPHTFAPIAYGISALAGLWVLARLVRGWSLDWETGALERRIRDRLLRGEHPAA